MVKEIGVRSTRLETIDDNIVVIGNHSISSVVNLTGKLSWYSLEIKVPIDTPLEEVEATLNRELSDIGKRCDKIVGQLSYGGVVGFGGGYSGPKGASITLSIYAQCNEKDLSEVSNFVNREVLLMMKREGIAIL